MGGVTHVACAHRHSQALDDALKVNGLAPEGVVRALAPSRSHHVGPLVPRDGVGWKKETKRGVGE